MEFNINTSHSTIEKYLKKYSLKLQENLISETKLVELIVRQIDSLNKINLNIVNQKHSVEHSLTVKSGLNLAQLNISVYREVYLQLLLKGLKKMLGSPKFTCFAGRVFLINSNGDKIDTKIFLTFKGVNTKEEFERGIAKLNLNKTLTYDLGINFTRIDLYPASQTIFDRRELEAMEEPDPDDYPLGSDDWDYHLAWKKYNNRDSD